MNKGQPQVVGKLSPHHT